MKRTNTKAFPEFFSYPRAASGAETLNDEWMLTRLRHSNARIAAERVLLLLYTVSNVHVIAPVRLLKDHSVLATEAPAVSLLLPRS